METSSDRIFYDAIVIGSGFGGGTIALRLAQAGKKVVVLERGRRWRGQNMPASSDLAETPFPQLGDDHFFWGRRVRRPDQQRLGLFEIRQMVNLQGMLGAGVGGGSLIWANVVIAATEQVFDNNWPSDLTLKMLEPYYRLADSYLRPQYVPGISDSAGNGRRVPRADALKSAAVSVGRKWQPVKIAVNFGDEKMPRSNGHGQAKQLGCNYCGLCSAGCPQNAKNTVDVSYIAEAESLGADVRALHQVTGVEPADGGYRVHFERYELDGTLSARGVLLARNVVVSAGAFGTTELLLKCRRRGLLPALSDALGTRFSANGNVLSGALKESTSNEQIAAMQTNSGPAITGMIDYGNFAVEDFPNPTWANGIIGGTNWGRIKAFVQAWLDTSPRPAPLPVRCKTCSFMSESGVTVPEAACGSMRLAGSFSVGPVA